MVELSIVIVIIGLIVAGVTAGSSLIKAAKLRTITSDITLYKTAYNTFRLQYDSIPGDMRNAYDYWGTTIGCTNNDINTVAGGCNGNGNRKIGGPTLQQNVHMEAHRAWQILGLTGLVPASYRGTGLGCWPGQTTPASRFNDKAAIDFFSMTLYTYFTSYNSASTNAAYRHPYNFISFGICSGGYALGGFINPADAYSLDSKVDDSLPQTGYFLGYTGSPATGGPESPVIHPCISGTAYDFSHNVTICSILSRMDY